MDKTNKELDKMLSKDSSPAKNKDKKEADKLESRMPEPVLTRKSSTKVTGKVESKPRSESVPVKVKADKCCKTCDCVKFSREEMKGLLSHLPTYTERDNVMSAKAKLLKALT